MALSLVEENEQKLLDAILQLTSQDLKLEQIEGYEPSWLDNPLNNNKTLYYMY